MKLLKCLIVFLALSRTGLCQSPPRMLGFSLGEIRSARHASYPCRRVVEGVDMCSVDDSTSITFLGDTLTDILIQRDLGLIANKTADQLWREVALPWAVARFGQPDSVRASDSTATTDTGVRTWMHTVTGYWTGAADRRWRANAFLVMVEVPERGALTGVTVALHCGRQPRNGVAACPGINVGPPPN